MSDQYLGEIRMFAGNYAPQGWAFCNGQLLTINGDTQALFSLIGTTYGGDGETTFGLPDLQGRLPIHSGTDPNSGDSYALGQKGGTETVTLTLDQLPAHTHSVNASNLAGTSGSPSNAYFADNTVNQYTTGATPNGAMSSATVSAVGGNQAHDNMMPFFTLSFIIALQGNYPSQQ